VSTNPASLSLESIAALDDLGPTLADVLAMVPGFTTISPQARHNMASAINTLARVLDSPAHAIPIAANIFRSQLTKAQPATLGISVRRWRNVASDVRRAIRLSGLSAAVVRSEIPLSDAWDSLLKTVADPWARAAVRRFGRFCSGHQQDPEAVDDAVVQQYLACLQASELARDANRSVLVLVRAWNKHFVSEAKAQYRRLAGTSRTRKYALDWHELPARLQEEVSAFHEQCLHPDPLDPAAKNPIRPATIRNRDFLIRRFAAALIARGVAVDELQRLEDLFRLDRLKEGLRYFLEHKGGKDSTQIPHFIKLAINLGKHWTHLPLEQINEMKTLCRRFQRPQNGLTEKNRSRLRQFSDNKIVGVLVALPARLVAKVKVLKPSHRSALLVQTALAIAVLILAPIRIGNLVALDRRQHFRWARHDGQRVLHLVIPAVEVKNSVDLEYPLPQELTALLDLYMTKYQPLMARLHPSGLLFPGLKGGPKQQEGFSRAISATIQRETGIKMNPHLFRHLAALLFLERHPGSYEEVRRILGQKRVSTTIQNYAGLEITAAVRRYDEVILSYRKPPSLKGPAP